MNSSIKFLIKFLKKNPIILFNIKKQFNEKNGL